MLIQSSKKRRVRRLDPFDPVLRAAPRSPVRQGGAWTDHLETRVARASRTSGAGSPPPSQRRAVPGPLATSAGLRPTRSTTTGTCGRSCRRTASAATAPIPRRAKRSCGSTLARSRSRSCRSRPASTRSCRGHADRSELVRRITAQDPEERMPPESTHKTLSKQQVAILAQWIDNGAEYRPHWAFIEPQRPKVPSTKLDARAKNDIDRFVFNRLEREGLAPAAEADKETLINRVTLTLDGPAADAHAGRRIPGRRVARRLREGRRSPACVARVRGAHGRVLDGPRALQRVRRLPRRSPRPLSLAVSRLGHRCVRPQHAVRRVRHVAARGRSAVAPDARADARDGVLARRQAHDRERRDRRRIQSRVHGRAHRQRARHCVPGTHCGLRALPRPQVRSDQAEGLLLARRVLQQQRRAGRVRAGLQRHPGRTDVAVADAAVGNGVGARGGRRCAARRRLRRRAARGERCGRQPGR